MTVPRPGAPLCSLPSCGKPLSPRLEYPGLYRRNRNGYCDSCTRRWRVAGKPEGGPPPPSPPGAIPNAERSAQRAERIARARGLHAQGFTTAAIAEAMSVNPSTVLKYLKSPPRKEPPAMTAKPPAPPDEPARPAGGPSLYGREMKPYERDIIAQAREAERQRDSAALLSIPGR